MFSLMGTIFPLIFLLVIIMIGFGIVKGITEWNHNNQQPILTVEAKIVSKRRHTSHHTQNTNGTIHTHNNTSYFVTFEVESGDRMEFRVSGREYGMLAEVDMGKLKFQGTRYLGFERIKGA